MAKKNNQLRWIIALGAILFIGVMAYSTLQETQQKYEVCVAFKGSTHCSTSSGASYDQAVHSAHEIDCELLSNGRDENMACLANQPTSIRPAGK
jgi:hypothetical protein